MKIIKGVMKDGILVPEITLPKGSQTVFDGVNYIVYEANDVLEKESNPTLKGEFLNKKIYNVQDVKRAVTEKISTIFAAYTNSGDKVADQLKLVCDVLVLLCAKEGWVSYSQAGIQGVSSETQAITYINDNLVPLLNQRNIIRQQAKQFIQDNGL